jgi:hypothetical protein
MWHRHSCLCGVSPTTPGRNVRRQPELRDRQAQSSLNTMGTHSGPVRPSRPPERPPCHAISGHCIAIANPGTPASSSACADATSSSSRVSTASTDVPSRRASSRSMSR